MERESFENEATAKILNDDFVSVKVDREERCACCCAHAAGCELSSAACQRQCYAVYTMLQRRRHGAWMF